MSEWKETTLGAVCENKSITYNFSNKERVIFMALLGLRGLMYNEAQR